MAFNLVGYMPCDQAVRSAILSEFDTAPHLNTIARIRKSRQAQQAFLKRGPIATGCEENGWDWTGAKYEEEMERASVFMVEAIKNERSTSKRLSAFRARRDRALASVREGNSAC